MKKILTLPEILNLDEASLFLRVGKKTLSNLAKKGKIPARKIGREWRFVKSVLLNWLSQGGVKWMQFGRKTAQHRGEITYFPAEYPQPLYLNNREIKSATKKDKQK